MGVSLGDPSSDSTGGETTLGVVRSHTVPSDDGDTENAADAAESEGDDAAGGESVWTWRLACRDSR